MIAEIESLSTLLEGSRESWLRKADKEIAKARRSVTRELLVCLPVWLQVSAGVHGPLLEALAEAVKFHDMDSIEMLRRGAPLVSVREFVSGEGVACFREM